MDHLTKRFGDGMEAATLTVRELAARLGCSERALYAYRAGERAVPAAIALRLAALLGERASHAGEVARRLEEAAERKESKR